MGRKLRVDFSNEQKSNEDGHNQVSQAVGDSLRLPVS